MTITDPKRLLEAPKPEWGKSILEDFRLGFFEYEARMIAFAFGVNLENIRTPYGRQRYGNH